MYKWQRIKALHAQGAGIRQIARTIGVSRNTVRKYLKEANPPQFKAREYVKELDRYQEEMLSGEYRQMMYTLLGMDEDSGLSAIK